MMDKTLMILWLAFAVCVLSNCQYHTCYEKITLTNKTGHCARDKTSVKINVSGYYEISIIFNVNLGHVFHDCSVQSEYKIVTEMELTTDSYSAKKDSYLFNMTLGTQHIQPILEVRNLSKDASLSFKMTVPSCWKTNCSSFEGSFVLKLIELPVRKGCRPCGKSGKKIMRKWFKQLLKKHRKRLRRRKNKRKKPKNKAD